LTKEDYVWVGIRIFGIYLLVLAVIALPTLINSAYMASQKSDASQTITNADSELSNGQTFSSTYYNVMLAARFRVQCVQQSMKFVIFALVGLYLACKGQLVFNLVSRPLRPKVYEESAHGGSASRPETSIFAQAPTDKSENR